MFQSAGDQFILSGELPPLVAAANTLPRDIAAFTGRKSELQRLTASVTELLASGQTLPILAIDGMPGVGKTTLAIHAAHLLARDFPDGKIFVDMHAHTPGKAPVEPAEALYALLSVDGFPAEAIPADLDGRSALWRARMAGRRSVLVVDNVIGHRQVEPLLPGAAGCLVLVTSRRRLTGLGVRHAATTLSLAPLSPELAADLFVQLAAQRPGGGAQEPAIMELVRLCGCLPLAVSLLAARLRPEPQWEVETLVEQLAAARDRLVQMRAEDIQIEAAFDLSYRNLSASRRRFFRRLGMSPAADIDAYAAAAVGDVSLAIARQHLEDLYNDHLLEQPVQGRYRLHDLLGVYARALATKDGTRQRDLASNRLLDYYQHTAGVANKYIAPRPLRVGRLLAGLPAAVPELADAAQATAWLSAELPNLFACATLAMSQGDDARLIGLSAVLAAFLRRAGPYRQSVALHRAAAEAASRSGDQAGRGVALHQLAVWVGRAGDYPAATEALDEARSLYRDLGDPIGEADVLIVTGMVKRLAGDYVAASDILHQALARFRHHSDRAGEAEALAELAVVQWLTDGYPAATQLLEQSLSLYREASNRQGQAYVLLLLGMLRRLTHDYPAAIQALQSAMDLYRGLGSRMRVAHAQFSLGVVRRLTGDRQGAMRAMGEVLQVYREVGDRLGQANTLRQVGILRRQANDCAGSTQALQESLSLYRDIGNRRGQAEVLQELGVVRRLTGDTDRAAADLAEALTIYQDLGSRSGQAEVCNYFGELLLGSDQPGARERFETALRLARQVENPLEEARALAGVARCSLPHDPAAATRQLREARSILQRIGSPEAEHVAGLLTSLEAS